MYTVEEIKNLLLSELNSKLIELGVENESGLDNIYIPSLRFVSNFNDGEPAYITLNFVYARNELLVDSVSIDIETSIGFHEFIKFAENMSSSIALEHSNDLHLTLFSDSDPVVDFTCIFPTLKTEIILEWDNGIPVVRLTANKELVGKKGGENITITRVDLMTEESFEFVHDMLVLDKFTGNRYTLIDNTSVGPKP